MAVEAIKVDLGAAIERCSGDTDLLSQVLSETFEKTRDEAIPQIKAAIEADDVNQVHFHAHSVKGSAATVGFLSLSAAAKKLDDVAKMKTLEGASEYLAELEMELDRAFDYHRKHTEAEEEALERCGGDKELFCQIAKEMVTEALPDQIKSLREGIEGKDEESVLSACEQLQDASETIGSAYLLSLAKSMVEGGQDKWESLLVQIEEEFEKVQVYWENVEGE